MVSVSDSVSFRFFSESRIQYRIRLDMGMIPDSDSSTQKLVSPTSGKLDLGNRVVNATPFFAGKFVHHDTRKPVETSSSIDQHQQQHGFMNGSSSTSSAAIPVQTLSNEALKVQCPFCQDMFAARYGFFQHLCDRHFKDTLASQVEICDNSCNCVNL